ncbi:MAG TPA: hypothetical protein VIT45_12495 [Allosphingosinicella sp.]
MNPEPLAGLTGGPDIGEWAFELDVGRPVPAGGFANILILKGRQGSIIDLAPNPNAWTAASLFSCRPGEAPGAVAALSQWLTDWLADAVERARQDPASIYSYFARIASEPSWTGILMLNVSLRPESALPPAIAGLAGGIDADSFAAHHLGINHSPVQGSAGPAGDDLSDLFGLIDYQAVPGAASAGSEPRPDAPAGSDGLVSLQVAQLSVLFANSAVTGFKGLLRIEMKSAEGFEFDVRDPDVAMRWQASPGADLPG